MYVYHVYAYCPVEIREGIWSPETGLQMAVKEHVGARNQTQVLSESNKSSQPLSRLSSSFLIIFCVAELHFSFVLFYSSRQGFFCVALYILKLTL